MRCPYKEAAWITAWGVNTRHKDLDVVASCDGEKCGKYRNCFNLEVIKAVPVEMKVDVEKIIEEVKDVQN